MPTARHLRGHTLQTAKEKRGPGENHQPGSSPAARRSAVPSPAWREMNQRLSPSAGQMCGREGRPLERRSVPAFEGCLWPGLVARVRWRARGRVRGETPGGGARRPPRLRGRSGRSLVWNRAVTGETLCLLTSKAASAASAAFEAAQQNTPSGRLNPPPARFQRLRMKIFPPAWLRLAAWWLSLCIQRFLLRLSELGWLQRFSTHRNGNRELKRVCG